MPRTANTSSSPGSSQLVPIPMSLLRPHPANANLMSAERRGKLAHNIRRQENYPPLIVRTHPTEPGCYQLLDGHQRADVLRELGHETANCYLWECDDQTALVLLATLNRLEGEDVPARRAELLAELSSLLSPAELALLLPESAAQIEDTLALLDFDSASLLAQLEAATSAVGDSPRAISFAVSADDEAIIEEAVRLVAAELDGPNRRGRALAIICGRHLDTRDD